MRNNMQDPFEPAVRPDKRKKKKPGQTEPGAVTGREASGKALKKEPQERFSHDIIWLQQQEMLRTQWTICDGADLYDESLELPSFLKLRHSMRKRCRDYSLEVSQESVEFLQKSLEVYIERVLEELQKAAKMRRNATQQASSPTSSEWATIVYEDFESAQVFVDMCLEIPAVSLHVLVHPTSRIHALTHTHSLAKDRHVHY